MGVSARTPPSRELNIAWNSSKNMTHGLAQKAVGKGFTWQAVCAQNSCSHVPALLGSAKRFCQRLLAFADKPTHNVGDRHRQEVSGTVASHGFGQQCLAGAWNNEPNQGAQDNDRRR